MAEKTTVKKTVKKADRKATTASGKMLKTYQGSCHCGAVRLAAI